MSNSPSSRSEPKEASKKPKEAPKVQAIRQKMEEDRKLEASVIKESTKLRETLPPLEKRSGLIIEAARGSPEAERQLADIDATKKRLEELAELVQALHDRRPRLESQLEEAILAETREERRSLADQEVRLAKEIETRLKKLAPVMAEWERKELESNNLTRKLGESVGLSPARKLSEALSQHLWPTVGKYLTKPSLSGDLVTWSQRFVDTAKDEK